MFSLRCVVCSKPFVNYRKKHWCSNECRRADSVRRAGQAPAELATHEEILVHAQSLVKAYNDLRPTTPVTLIPAEGTIEMFAAKNS